MKFRKRLENGLMTVRNIFRSVIDANDTLRMPISLRTVDPVDVSLGRLSELNSTRDELQCVANGTLANLIRQLSSLNVHAEQMFSDMHQDVLKLNQKLDNVVMRTNRLTARLHDNVNAVHHTGRLAENNMRKAYRSTDDIDQHSLSRHTLPRALVEFYDRCDPPPALNHLNQFRDDPKDALKYYTDPGYFFDLWKQEILKECNIDKRIRMAKAPLGHAHQQNIAVHQPRRVDSSRKVVQHHSRTLLNHYADQNSLHTNNLVQFPTEYQAPQINRYVPQQPPPGMIRPVLIRPTNAAPPLPDQFDDEPLPPPPVTTYRAVEEQEISADLQAKATLSPLEDPSQFPNIDDDDDLPPPPPPLSTHTQMNLNMQYLAPAPSLDVHAPLQNTASSVQAPIPPPPPPPLPSTTTIMTESVIQSSFVAQIQVNSESEGTVERKNSVPTQPSSLLMEIHSGFKLRKVQRKEEANRTKAAIAGNDVAAILKRRMEQTMGNSSDEDHNEDDDEWDD